MTFKVREYDVKGIIYLVDWPIIDHNIRQLIKQTDLFEVMFKHANSKYAGLAIKLNNGEFDIMWVNSDIRFNKYNYIEYVRDMYEVVGMAFKNQQEANVCAEVMNKKLVWDTLTR